MRNIRMIALTVLAVSVCVCVVADDPGRQAYKDGQYGQALEYYTAVLNEQGPSADVYFNMANCMLKMREPGRAIAYYKRALWFAPRDQDVRANLKRAYQQAGTDDPDQRGLFAEFCLYWHHGLSMKESWFTAVALYGSGVFLICLWFVRRRRVLIRAAVLLISAAAIFSGSVIVKYSHRQYPDRGVVIADKAAVYSGKGMDYSRILQIKEGTILRILEQEEKWCKILAGKSKKGWISAEDIILY